MYCGLISLQMRAPPPSACCCDVSVCSLLCCFCSLNYFVKSLSMIMCGGGDVDIQLALVTGGPRGVQSPAPGVVAPPRTRSRKGIPKTLHRQP